MENKCVEIPDNITTFIVEIPYYLLTKNEQILAFKFTRQIILSFKPYIKLQIKFNKKSPPLEVTNIYFDYERNFFILSTNLSLNQFSWHHIYYLNKEEWSEFEKEVNKSDSNYQEMPNIKIGKIYVSKLLDFMYAGDRRYYKSPECSAYILNSTIKEERKIFEKDNFEFEILDENVKKIYNINFNG